MRPRVLLAFVGSVTILACDRPPSPPAPSPGPSGVETLTGGERLGWDQRAGDLVELGSFGYAIYVDGVRSIIGGASCGTAAGPAGFACSAPVPAMSPGAHTLELATFVAGTDPVLESERSQPVQVVVISGQVGMFGASTAGFPTGEAVVTATDDVRLRLELVMGGLDQPTDLAFAPDGRLLIAERAGRVRLIEDGRVRAEPALVLSDVSATADGGLLGLALDPAFERTGFVYLLYTAPSPEGGPVFRLARAREADNALVDPVVLLDAIPAAPGRAAGSIRFGPDEKLYAAFDDGGDARLAGDLSAFSGKVLRLNPDGSTPGDQAAATPVYAVGYRAPSGLDWQPGSGTLWVVDHDSPGSARLSAVASGDEPRRRGRALAEYRLPDVTAPGSLAFYRERLIPAFRGDLLAAAGDARDILRIRFDQQDPTRVTAIDQLLQDRVGPVRAVRVGPDGAVYFCSEQAVGRLVPW